MDICIQGKSINYHKIICWLSLDNYLKVNKFWTTIGTDIAGKEWQFNPPVPWKLFSFLINNLLDPSYSTVDRPLPFRHFGPFCVLVSFNHLEWENYSVKLNCI